MVNKDFIELVKDTYNYRWDVMDIDGWELEENLYKKRHFELCELQSINIDELSESIGDDIMFSIMVNDDNAKDFSNMIYIIYRYPYLKISSQQIKKLKFKMKFSETDKFIENFIIDNNYTLSPRNEIR